jgi:type IV pilus assembly protein PilA
MKNTTAKKQGFTLVEIMIVVAIIGLLAAIAIPNFVKSRTR